MKYIMYRATRLLCPRFGSRILPRYQHLHQAQSQENKLYFFEDWEPPYLETISEKKVELNKTLNQCSPSGSQDVADHSNLILHFIDVTQKYNETSDLDPSENDRLNQIVSEYKKKASLLSFEDLVLSIKILCCWPHAVKLTGLRKRVPDRTELAIRDLFDILSTECVDRSWYRESRNHSYISFGYENLDGILDLCEIWQNIEKFTKFNSFVNTAVNKIANSERNSKSKFKRMDKDTFVRFMRLVRTTQVNDDFHSYYCTFKFLDLIKEMSLDDMTISCQALTSKKFFGTSAHPVDVELRKQMILKIMNNIHQVTSEHLIALYTFIHPVQSWRLRDDCVALQDLLFKSGHWKNVSLESLILTVNMCSRLVNISPVNKHLVDTIIAESMKLNDQQLINLPNVCLRSLSHMVAYHRDTPEGRLLLIRIRDCMLEHEPSKLQTRDMLNFVYNLIILQICIPQVFSLVFTSPSIVAKSKTGETDLNPIIKFSSLGPLRAYGGLALSILGSIQLDHPSYTGPAINHELENLIMRYCLSPSEVEKCVDQIEMDEDYDWDEQTFHKTSKFLMFHMIEKSLCELYGREKVHLSLALPYFGILGSVMILDSSNKFVNIPDSFKDQQIHETKKTDPTLGTWILFLKVSGTTDVSFQMKYGGVNNLVRIVQKAGYLPVIVDQDLCYSLIFDPTYREMSGEERYRASLEAHKEYLKSVLNSNLDV